ncbi:uncharacterized protein EV422DRAFT_92101 [Fimicolochytrium jonesii]|uniref:uncharacterized protein n=1 Tax=Fimicolochytrium jonesii TaxID=1396493 RepID=UPI0022FF3758|nr:uncharacterized protein EV422DRAFT_92101 [Fimicolochytrium jonesii]KAI8819929.1 hypothetical protein EV422DRAFT_92101 [Fimicolochytrium jonesii]
MSATSSTDVESASDITQMASSKPFQIGTYIHWTIADKPDKVHATDLASVKTSLSSADVRATLLSQLGYHPSDASHVLTLCRADGSVIPLTGAIPPNSCDDAYVLHVVKAVGDADAVAVPAAAELPAKRAELEDVHAEIDALKWQVRLMKKQLALGGPLSAGGATPPAPMSSDRRHLTDEEAQEIIQDLEMLATELTLVHDLGLPALPFRRFLFGLKDAFEKSSTPVDFRQSHQMTRAVFHVLKANHVTMKWKGIDKLVCLLSTLTYGLRKPTADKAAPHQESKSNHYHAQDQFSIITSLLNTPPTNFLSHLDPHDFKDFKEALKSNLSILAAPRTFLPEIPARKINPNTTAKDGKPHQSQIPSVSAVDRFSKSTTGTTAQLKRRGSLDLKSRAAKPVDFGEFKKSAAAAASPVAVPAATPPPSPPTAVVETPTAGPTPREDKVMKERQLARM